MRLAYLLPVYWAAVVVCLNVASNQSESVAGPGWVAVFVLTLPWSLVPLFFTWALMHDQVGASFFVTLAIIFAILNSFLLYGVTSAVVRQGLKRATSATAISPRGQP
jgi:hypothetical protein